jgi:hypothetical protein
MRQVSILVFAGVLFTTASSVHSLEASCDFRKCMSICRSDYESGCAGMCGRIILLCKQLVLRPERTSSVRRSSREGIKLHARARGSYGRID